MRTFTYLKGKRILKIYQNINIKQNRYRQNQNNEYKTIYKIFCLFIFYLIQIVRNDFSKDVKKRINKLQFKQDLESILKDYLINFTEEEQIKFLSQNQNQIREKLFDFDQERKGFMQLQVQQHNIQKQQQIQYREDEESQIDQNEQEQEDDLNTSEITIDSQQKQISIKTITKLISEIKDRIISKKQYKIINESNYAQDVLQFCFIPIVYIYNNDQENKYSLLIVNNSEEIVFTTIEQLRTKTLNDETIKIADVQDIDIEPLKEVAKQLQTENMDITFEDWQLDIINSICNYETTKQFKHLRSYWDLDNIDNKDIRRYQQELIQRQEILQDEIDKPISQRDEWFKQFQLFNKKEIVDQKLKEIEVQINERYGVKQTEKVKFLTIDQSIQILSQSKQMLKEYKLINKNKSIQEEKQVQKQFDNLIDDIKCQQKVEFMQDGVKIITNKEQKVPISSLQYKFIPVDHTMTQKQDYIGIATIIKIISPITNTKIFISRIDE